MSRHLAPGLVTAEDVVTFDLASMPVHESGKRCYRERIIHGEVYKARPDVVAVVHCHAPILEHRIKANGTGKRGERLTVRLRACQCR